MRCVFTVDYVYSDIYMVLFLIDSFVTRPNELPSWLVPAGLEISLSKAWKPKDLVWFAVCRLLSRVHPCPGASAG